MRLNEDILRLFPFELPEQRLGIQNHKIEIIDYTTFTITENLQGLMNKSEKLNKKVTFFHKVSYIMKEVLQSCNIFDKNDPLYPHFEEVEEIYESLVR